MLQVFTLKNGLKVATYSIPQMRSVFLSESVMGGSMFDTEKTSGRAHFMEHILCEGIPSLPNVEAFADFIEKVAGSFNASTGASVVRYYMNAPVTVLEDVIKISSEVFFEPLFPEDSIEKERGAISDEIRQRQDQLWYKNRKFFTQNRFKGRHPLKLDGGGSLEAIAKLQKKDLVEFWDTYFHPKNTYLVLVGGFKSDDAKKLIEKYYAKYKSKKTFPGFPKFDNKDFTDGGVVIRSDMELRACYVDLTFPAIPDNAPIEERFQHSLTRAILGNLRGSRLYRLLRHQRGLVYDVGSGVESYRKFGYASVYFQSAADQLDEVLSLVIKELVGFIQNGPTDDEVEFAKNYQVNRTLMSFDHPGTIASWIEGDLLWEDKIYTPEETAEMIKKIRREDIIKFIKKNWDFSRKLLTIQGPVSGSKENQSKYEKIVSDLV